MNPKHYEAWYESARGSWIAGNEHALMMRMLAPSTGDTLLDAGCGTGHFSRRFAAAGRRVTGLDPDAAMLDYARGLGGGVNYLRGTATALPLVDDAFDIVTAVTSLCFIVDAPRALREMWRVARHAVVLGLLNRRSLLYRHKHGSGGYRGTRWDTSAEVRQWAQSLEPAPCITVRSAIFLPSGSGAARAAECLLPSVLPWGGFLAVHLRKPDHHETI